MAVPTLVRHLRLFFMTHGFRLQNIKRKIMYYDCNIPLSYASSLTWNSKICPGFRYAHKHILMSLRKNANRRQSMTSTHLSHICNLWIQRVNLGTRWCLYVSWFLISKPIAKTEISPIHTKMRASKFPSRCRVILALKPNIVVWNLGVYLFWIRVLICLNVNVCINTRFCQFCKKASWLWTRSTTFLETPSHSWKLGTRSWLNIMFVWNSTRKRERFF